MSLTTDHYHRNLRFHPVTSLGAITSFMVIVLSLWLSGCSSGRVGASGESVEISVKKNETMPISSQNNHRAWIKSLTLMPVLPNRDQNLNAVLDWEPKGQSGISATYQWFVNGIEVYAGDSNLLPLPRFRSGDRVYVIASLITSNGHVAAAQRSRSVVIQNRVPILNSELIDLTHNNNELIGHIGFSDPDGDKVTVKLLEGPAGLIVGTDGTVHWPLSQVKTGAYQMTLELVDERGLGIRGTLSFNLKQAT